MKKDDPDKGITKIPSGLYRWTVSTGRRDSRGRYIRETGTSHAKALAIRERNARKKYWESERQERKVQRRKSYDPLVREYLGSWLAGRTDLEATTRGSHERYVRLHIVPAIGHMRLSQVSPADVDDMTARMVAAGMSKASARQARSILSGALRRAVAERLAKRVPTPDEIRRAAEVAMRHHPTTGLLVHLAIVTGCRRGELCAIQWAYR